jgi:hypothetical protein
MRVDQESVMKLAAELVAQDPDCSVLFRPAQDGQSMLLAYQTGWQRDLLRRYGSTIVGMDATYKTHKWGFPLFLCNVVTNNRRGHPVALFLVQSKDATSIAEALSV